MAANATLAIMDLEFTAWEGSSARRWSGPGEEMEIVQIGAIKIKNDAALTEFDSLDILVVPKINPDLSDYFIDLTGITQSDVDAHGLDYGRAFERLRGFIGDATQTVYSWGEDYRVLQRNCRLNGLSFPYDETLFVNARRAVKGILDDPENKVFSSGLPDALGFPPPGAAHQGLDDCRCIAEALRMARRKGLF